MYVCMYVCYAPSDQESVNAGAARIPTTRTALRRAQRGSQQPAGSYEATAKRSVKETNGQEERQDDEAVQHATYIHTYIHVCMLCMYVCMYVYVYSMCVRIYACTHFSFFLIDVGERLSTKHHEAHACIMMYVCMSRVCMYYIQHLFVYIFVGCCSLHSIALPKVSANPYALLGYHMQHLLQAMISKHQVKAWH